MQSLSAPDLADAAAEAVRALIAESERAQPSHGLDALEETAFQDSLARELVTRGLEVEREVRYPVHRRRDKKSQGFRCDFVIGRDEPEPWWIELKLVAQFNESGPNKRFRSVVRRAAVDDVVKLACDPDVPRRALLLVLHTASTQDSEQGVLAFASRCADEGLPIEVPRVRHVPLVDRLGNRDCALALVPVGGLAPR
jgi:hypothetical protein